MTKHIESIDVLKGITIILVVIGHAVQGVVSGQQLTINTEYSSIFILKQIIYGFHMPLFFMIAGLFVNSWVKRSFKEAISQKIIRLVVPYFIWSAITSIAMQFASSYTNDGLGIKEFLLSPIIPFSQYWFLYVLFFIHIIFFMLVNIKICNGKLLFLLISIVVYFLNPLINSVWIFDNLFRYMIFFSIGSYVLDFINLKQFQCNKIILPIEAEEKMNLKKSKVLANKTKKILSKTNCNKVILSKEIKKQQDYQNYLYTYNFDIIDGRWLFEVLMLKSLKYIIEKKNMKKEEVSISILVNDINENILENIKEIVKEYKKINIVTNHIEKFKKIEKQILEKEGIMLVISNNRRKSLLKSKIILNIDFPTELINKYQIYEEAIIVNLKGNVKIEKKRFNGININDYEICFKYEDEFDFEKKEKYNKKDIYEAKIVKKQPYKFIMKRIDEDQVKIIELVGNKSTI